MNKLKKKKMVTFPDEVFSLVLYSLYISRLSLDINVFAEVSIEINMLVRGHFCRGKHSPGGSSEIFHNENFSLTFSL